VIRGGLGHRSKVRRPRTLVRAQIFFIGGVYRKTCFYRGVYIENCTRGSNPVHLHGIPVDVDDLFQLNFLFICDFLLKFSFLSCLMYDCFKVYFLKHFSITNLDLVLFYINWSQILILCSFIIISHKSWSHVIDFFFLFETNKYIRLQIKGRIVL